MNNFLKILTNYIEKILVFLLSLIFIITFILVLLRYVFNQSITGANEIVTILFIYTTAFAVSINTSCIGTLIFNPLKSFGVNPQELAAIDIYQALQTGVIDGQDNPPANIWDFKMHEVSKYLTVTNYATGPDPFIVNLKWYNTLTPELKIIFDRVAKETMARSDEMNKEKESEYLDMLSKYLQINFITNERLIPFQKAVKPVYDYFINKGMFTMDEIQTAQNFAKNLK